MAIWGPRVVSTPEAAELADLAGAMHDLETASAFCKELRAVDITAPKGHVLVDALSTAIVIRYSRCFTSGVRRKLSDEIVANLPEQLRTWHKLIRTIRDKHVAHSVNALEENRVTVTVREPPDPPAIGGVGLLGARTMALSVEAAEHVGKLCDAVAAALQELIKSQQALIREQIEALPIVEVYALPEPDAYAPDFSQIGSGRPRK